MNEMCDLPQLFVYTPTYNITAESLVKLFMEEVFLNFVTCAVIVVDDGINFKGTFQTMCKSLKITYWIISRGNHNRNSVEKFHWFLNNTQTITGGDRGKHIGFIHNAKTSQYTWNIAPIDDTDISLSLKEIGREFCFTLDVDIFALSSMNTPYNYALLHYLQDVSTDSQFATWFLQVLVQERRTRHQERHKSTITAKTSLQVGDIVKDH